MNSRITAQKKSNKGKTVGISPFISILLSLAFMGLSVLLVVNSVKSVERAYQRSKLLDQAEEEVQALRLRNLELLQKKDTVSGDSYVEEQARDRLLFTKEGEVLVVLPESLEDPDTDKEEEVLGEETAVSVGSEDDGWTRWWKVLLEGV